ncbi:hypothetical protein GBAR_LOCUS19669 [Geodia barretti]|uniref:Uncharacterized protein n=1 Tax=Geodia barretti TaxID=519541 RepID=A0AA35SSF3_GEOBA|nr:hypothetical protein GBAR_LOCUS19669 [Geodia barretti]
MKPWRRGRRRCFTMRFTRWSCLPCRRIPTSARAPSSASCSASSYSAAACTCWR